MSPKDLDFLTPETREVVEKALDRPATPTIDISTPAKTIVPMATPLLNALSRRQGGSYTGLAVEHTGPLPSTEGDAIANQTAALLRGLKLVQESAIYVALYSSRFKDVVGDAFPVSQAVVETLVERGVTLDTHMDHYESHSQDGNPPTLRVSSSIGVILPGE
jgi:hypothetical protein